MIPNLTTELDAVNTMLSIIGESPVSRLDDNGVVDAVVARRILAETSLEVQSRGWHWNTEAGFTLTPTVPDGNLIVPGNTLELVCLDPRFDVAVRGTKLYDRANFTFTFAAPLKVRLVLLLDFQDMPQPARGYIAVRAGRTFQDRVVGSKDLAGFNEKDEMRALVTLQNHEADTAGLNMKNSVALRDTLGRRFGTWR